ncbi:sugar ABC transporter ATP-binding protein [Aminicella lysinilytica]|uniref:sugar ABC transporter ATP-binding protein n=1 Tax=Aminicella lysinilytica TaxID=433323 RepID=UPI0026EEB371|nr:sugar ABC transporter ATP-binding protein [Aminicella lysinilytica]
MTNDNGKAIIRTKGLTKEFGGTIALHDVDIDFREGEIHALAGENGAGKSTLCKMLSGAITPTAGTIELLGREFTKLTPHEAKENGISMIYQEFNLVPDLTIYENIFLGKEIRKGLAVNNAEMIRQTKTLFDDMEISIDPMATIAEISVAYCQLVEIAKALKEDAKVIIMDEPTAPLTNQEVEVLFRLVKNLKSKGITIIYISHRMEEIMQLSDRVTVMRDGALIATTNIAETTVQQIIAQMVGRELGMDFPARGGYEGKKETALSVRGLCNNKIHDISFDLHKGEILGLAGLVGAGRTEVLRAIFGADKLSGGTIQLNGKDVCIKSPTEAIKMGIGMIPEDRKRQGVHLGLPIRTNMSIIQIKNLSSFLTVQKSKEDKLIDDYIGMLSIKMGSPEDEAQSLSGGNQQKVVLTKWLATKADILFFDEPTRGIDVGAKAEIYELMAELRRAGKAIIMISSEMTEVIGMCDRIIVMYEGRIMGELELGSAQEEIMHLASGMQEK